LPKHPNKTYGTRLLSQIEQIIIHHSLTTSGSALAYANFHIDNYEWPGIGYHYVIDKNGTINQTNYLDTRSYHVSGHNTESIGICLTGNFDIEVPTPEQEYSLILLIRHLHDILYDYTGALAIKSHNEFSQKTCPGLNFDIESIRAVV